MSHDWLHARLRDRYRADILAVAGNIVQSRDSERRGSSLLSPGLLGSFCAEDSQDDAARACLEYGLSLDCKDVLCWAELAGLLNRNGDTTAALGAALRAIVLAPTFPELYGLLGRVLARADRGMEAVAAYEEAARLLPICVNTLGELGDLLNEQGRRDAALRCYRHALTIAGPGATIYGRIAHTLEDSGDPLGAEDAYRRATELCPSDAGLHVGLGQTLAHRGAYDEALVEFQDALALDCTNDVACRGILRVLECLDRRDEIPGAWFCLGRVLEEQERMQEAAVAYQTCLTLEPGFLRALLGLGRAHALTTPRKALSCYEAALALEPSQEEAQWYVAQLSLFLGDADAAWAQYARCDAERMAKLGRFEQPAWDGADLAGRTILLWTTWGLGDTLQLIRYARNLKALGARVVVECDKVLLPLLALQPDVDEVVARNTPLPKFDVHLHMLSLPGMLSHGRAVPAEMPYLMVDASLVTEWRNRLGRGAEKTIGLVWASGPARKGERFRFATLSTLSPLTTRAGVRFISLQQGAPAMHLIAPGSRVELFHEESRSIADTAALIANLDLVITVDTMTAHLAGALGRPVWTLLAHTPDWRWETEGDECAWYPTMRVFRQPRVYDWNDVVRRVRMALAEVVAPLR